MSISTNVTPKLSLALAVWSALRYDFKSMELQMEFKARYDYRDSDTIDFLKGRKQALGLEYTVHAPYLKIDLAAKDEALRLQSCSQILDILPFCEEMDVSRLTVHTGQRKTGEFSQLLRSLAGIVSQAKAYGVSICLENTGSDRPGWLLLTEEECLLACEQTGCLLTLDLVHIFSASSNPIATLQKLLTVAGNCHLSDTIDQQHLHLPLGFGNLPVGQIFEVLDQSHYRNKVVVDAVEKEFGPEVYLENAAAFRDGDLRI